MKVEIIEYLDALGIPYRLVEHEAVFTVEESSRQLKDKEPIKNLLLQDKSGQFFLVIMSGEERLDIKLLAEKLNVKKLQFASAERLMELLGVTPGAVSLFGLFNDTEGRVSLVIEERLLKVKELGFHPNDNTATIFMSPDQVKAIAKNLHHEIVTVEL